MIRVGHGDRQASVGTDGLGGSWVELAKVGHGGSPAAVGKDDLGGSSVEFARVGHSWPLRQPSSSRQRWP